MAVEVTGPSSTVTVLASSNTVEVVANATRVEVAQGLTGGQSNLLANAGTTSLVASPSKIGSALQLKGLIDSATLVWAAVGNDLQGTVVDKDSTSIADFTIGEKFYLTQRVSARAVSRINIVIQGSAGQSVTWELRKGSDLSAAGTVIHTATTTDITTGVTITTITTPAVVAGDHLWFEFTASAGTLVAFNATVSF